ncbi:hypothetical protein V6N11_034777 [Hibiscus sabdariffa]|uniref:Uncharacterized protein n=1 Tax=Hibiscus sabdariffa TaxID=183260 RepID=A0ABR2NRZ1_9ROSI
MCSCRSRVIDRHKGLHVSLCPYRNTKLPRELVGLEVNLCCGRHSYLFKACESIGTNGYENLRSYRSTMLMAMGELEVILYKTSIYTLWASQFPRTKAQYIGIEWIKMISMQLME